MDPKLFHRSIVAELPRRGSGRLYYTRNVILYYTILYYNYSIRHLPRHPLAVHEARGVAEVDDLRGVCIYIYIYIILLLYMFILYVYIYIYIYTYNKASGVVV